MQNDSSMSHVALLPMNCELKCLELLHMQFGKCQMDQTDEPKFSQQSLGSAATEFILFLFFCQDSSLKFLI